jgi:DNA gyrase subunit A
MIIRTHLDQISTIGRDTQGVKIISLNEGHGVASIAIVPRSNDEDDEDVFENDDEGYLENHQTEASDLSDEDQGLLDE